ncbi:MAG: hypothetical protein LIO90_03495 [Bacteroidales bacterium]|nr:hypothetical protein [Bacteroidales bacterium]
MKTEIYNLIILDESGSMDCVKSQTISGCNETINTIRSAQEAFATTQDHYVSIFAFQSNDRRPSRYLIKNQPIGAVSHINGELYDPWGGTPLYDAVGSTLVDLRSVVNSKPMAIGSVTIITDGMENSSRHYTRARVANMIDELKEMGWNFNFIGANIDVQRAASSLNIDNALEFKQDDAGTREMFDHQNACRQKYYARADRLAQECPGAAPSMMKERLKKASQGFFDEEDA